MYQTLPSSSFSAARQPPSESEDENPDSAPVPKKARKSTRSCAECRRRRIRCDGKDAPCAQCTWYKVPELCHYPPRQRRKVPSQESFAAQSRSLDKSNTVLKSLFPSASVDDLSALSRQELVALILSPEPELHRTSKNHGEDEVLQCLEPSPQQEFQWDESMKHQDPSSKVSDDVNGLSLALDSNSSYLGISSINAVLRVIAHISPKFRSRIQQKTSLVVPEENTPNDIPAPRADERTLIDAYFEHIHCITPIIDEAEFRTRYADGDDGAPWQALLNMVLAMGSIATSEPDEETHVTFYSKAYQNLGLDSFGSGHIETVQALGLLGGYYCHYVNRLNMANVLMGASLRMAIAMGLHREPTGQTKENSGVQDRRVNETRRRVWWSLFCLDTWASLTLGRPSLGRWDPDTITVNLPTRCSVSDLACLSLQAAAEFCKIGTALQDRFARQPLISCQEILEFDRRIVSWYDNVSATLKGPGDCPSGFRAARASLNMRYQNFRLVLHRPRLLTTTASRIPRENLPPDERIVVDKCREISSQIVLDTAIHLIPIQLCTRNSIWFLFQACMVPLLSMFSEPGHEDFPKWKAGIETSIGLFKDMSSWSLTVRRTREVVQTIYEASLDQENASSGADTGQDFTWDPLAMEAFWNDADWASIPGMNDFTFDATDFGVMDFPELGSASNFGNS